MSTSQQAFSSTADSTSKSLYVSGNQTTFNTSRAIKGMEGIGEESRRHIERLLLKLDFNGGLSKPRKSRIDQGHEELEGVLGYLRV